MRVASILVLPVCALLIGGCVSQEKYDKEVQLEEQEKMRLEKEKMLAEQYEALNKQFESEIRADQIKVTQMEDRLKVTFVDEILFASGSAKLAQDGKSVLDKALPTLSNLTGHWIDVQGYTDNVPIGAALKGRYPSNWELSSARATAVLRYLQEKGVDPSNMVACAFSEYQPVASNETPDGRKKNRRIEIELRSKKL